MIKSIKKSAICLLAALTSMSMCLLSNTAFAATDESGQTIVAYIGETGYTQLSDAIKAANETSGATIRVVEDCSLTYTATLTHPMTIVCENNAVITAQGEATGITINGTAGNYTFTNVTLNATVNSDAISIQGLTEDTRPHVTITNSKITSSKNVIGYGTGDESQKSNYFDLTITDSTLVASQYGNGISETDNNYKPDVSSSTINISNTTFASGTTLMTYGLFVYNPLKTLNVSNCTFNNAQTAGLRYYYDASSAVSITGNDFTKCTTAYATCVYNHANMDNAKSYQFADTFTNNTLTGVRMYFLSYNTGTALETIWAPSDNTYNSATRLCVSTSSKIKSGLFDFNIADSDGVMNLTSNGSSESTSYNYEMTNAGGAYTDILDASKITSSLLTNWSKANALTRWYVNGSSTPLTLNDDNTYTYEDETVKIVIDASTGKITATPRSGMGTYTLKGIVAGGSDGSLANAKTKTLTINVGSATTFTYTDSATGASIADTTTQYVSTTQTITDLTSGKKITGYAYNADKSSITTEDGSQIYHSVYDKLIDVTINYVDENGNKIADSTTYSNQNSTQSYDYTKTTSGKAITHYAYDHLTKTTDAWGNITYTVSYNKMITVTVNYVDGDGTVLKSAVTRTVTAKSHDESDLLSQVIVGYTYDHTSTSTDDFGNITYNLVYTSASTALVTTNDTTTPTTTVSSTATTTTAAANTTTTTATTDTTDDTTSSTPSTTTQSVEENKTAKASLSQTGSWALVNLICTVLTILAGLLLILKKHKKSKQDEKNQAMEDENNEDTKKRRRLPKLIALLIAILSVVVFILTEDLTLPMTYVDQWTLLMVVLLIFQIMTFILGSHWKKNDKQNHQKTYSPHQA